MSVLPRKCLDPRMSCCRCQKDREPKRRGIRNIFMSGIGETYGFPYDPIPYDVYYFLKYIF